MYWGISFYGLVVISDELIFDTWELKFFKKIISISFY